MGTGEELGGHLATGQGQPLTHTKMFPTHLSALTEKYTKTERNMAKPINFLSGNLLLTEHQIFLFSN